MFFDESDLNIESVINIAHHLIGMKEKPMIYMESYFIITRSEENTY